MNQFKGKKSFQIFFPTLRHFLSQTFSLSHSLSLSLSHSLFLSLSFSVSLSLSLFLSLSFSVSFSLTLCLSLSLSHSLSLSLFLPLFLSQNYSLSPFSWNEIPKDFSFKSKFTFRVIIFNASFGRGSHFRIFDLTILWHHKCHMISSRLPVGPDYNIWPFTATKKCTKSLKVAKVGSKFCQMITKEHLNITRSECCVCKH